MNITSVNFYMALNQFQEAFNSFVVWPELDPTMMDSDTAEIFDSLSELAVEVPELRDEWYPRFMIQCSTYVNNWNAQKGNTRISLRFELPERRVYILKEVELNNEKKFKADRRHPATVAVDALFGQFFYADTRSNMQVAKRGSKVAVTISRGEDYNESGRDFQHDVDNARLAIIKEFGMSPSDIIGDAIEMGVLDHSNPDQLGTCQVTFHVRVGALGLEE